MLCCPMFSIGDPIYETVMKNFVSNVNNETHAETVLQLRKRIREGHLEISDAT